MKKMKHLKEKEYRFSERLGALLLCVLLVAVMVPRSLWVSAETTGNGAESGRVTPFDSSDASIAALEVEAFDGSGGSLGTCSGTISGTTITISVPDDTETITVTTLTLAEGATSPALTSLAIGNNSLTVTAQDGTTTAEYTITVTKGSVLSNEAAITALTVSASDGVNEPVPRTGTIEGTSITLSVPYETTTITVTGISLSTGAGADLAVDDTRLVVGNDNEVVVTAQDGVTTVTYTVIITRENKVPGTSENVTITFSADGAPLDASAVSANIVSVTLSVGSTEVAGVITGDSASFSAVDGTQELSVTVDCEDASIYSDTTSSVTLEDYDGSASAFVVDVELGIKELNVYTYHMTANAGAWESDPPVTKRDEVPTGGKVIANNGYCVKSVALYSCKIEKNADIDPLALVDSKSPLPSLVGEFSPVFDNSVPSDALDVTYVIEYEEAYTFVVEREMEDEDDDEGDAVISVGGTDYPIAFTDNVGKVVFAASDIAASTEVTLKLTPSDEDHSAAADLEGEADTTTEPGSYIYTFHPSNTATTRAMTVEVNFPIITYKVTVPDVENSTVTLYDGDENEIAVANGFATVNSGEEVIFGIKPSCGFSVDADSLKCTVDDTDTAVTSSEQADGEVRTDALTVRGGDVEFFASVIENQSVSWTDGVTLNETFSAELEDTSAYPKTNSEEPNRYLYAADTALEILPGSSFDKMKLKYKLASGEAETYIGGGQEFNDGTPSNETITILSIEVAENGSYLYENVELPVGGEIISGAENSLIFFFEADITKPKFCIDENGQNDITCNAGDINGEGGVSPWTDDQGTTVLTDDITYYNGLVTITGTVDDRVDWHNGIYNSGIQQIWCEYDTVEYDDENGTSQVIPKVESSDATYPKDNDSTSKNDDTYQFALTIDLSQADRDASQLNVKIYLKDAEGIDGDPIEYIINYDNSKPELNEVTFSQDNGDIETKLNTFGFGTFFKPELKVVVQVEDAVTRVKSASLLIHDGSNIDEPLCVLDRRFIRDDHSSITLTLDQGTYNREYQGSAMSVVLIDELENKNVILVTTENSNIEDKDSGVVMIEKTAPSTSLTVSGGKVYSSPAGDIYNGDVTYSISASDSGSGLNRVRFSVNGRQMFNQTFAEEAERKGEPERRFSRSVQNAGEGARPDGGFEARLEAVDNAGNVAGTKTITTFVDRTAPQIVRYEFSAAGSSEIYTEKGFTEEFQENVELTEYGFWFKTRTQVKILAEDTQETNEAASGVKEVAVCLYDYTTGTYQALTADGSFVDVSESELDTIGGISRSEVVFTIPGDFKGQIFARATDNVDNTADDFTTPKGTIVETPELHETEKHIEFSRPTTAYKTAEGQDLYAANVNVGLVVTDQYSGIRKIEWSIKAPWDDKDQSGTVDVTEDGQILSDGSEDCIGDWEEGAGDRNLVYQLRNTFAVTNNSNQIAVTVKLTDCSGNVSEEKAEFSIDRTAPTIQVTYDNNSPDATYTEYYNADRIATIVVTERNFDPALVIHSITNTDGVIPGLAGWTTSVSTSNPDLTTHSAVIAYSADGDYTFNISARDRAQNAAAPFAQQQFTIDKTAPVMSIAYDNNNAQNGSYYKESRVATVTVQEHNFDAGRVNLQITRNGAPVDSAVTWSTDGDVSTARIDYSVDGDYGFSATYADRAGNQGVPPAENSFTIDHQFDSLVISGVSDGKAYGRSNALLPEIRFHDTNLGNVEDAVKITLVRQVWGEEADVSDRIVGGYDAESDEYVYRADVFDGLEYMKQENDGLYLLTVTVHDLAGNYPDEDTAEIGRDIKSGKARTTTSGDAVAVVCAFSVNRFGSVYIYNDEIKRISDGYVQAVSDLGITEYNPTKVNSANIEVTRDGVPVQTDLQITPVQDGKEEADDVSGWYRYEYVIPQATFEREGAFADGVYHVTLASSDEAGNESETINYEDQDPPEMNGTQMDGGMILFRLDTTAPELMVTGIDGASINASSVPVTVEAFDAIGLASVDIYLNDSETPIKHFEIGNLEDPSKNAADLNDFKGDFEMGEGMNQKLRIRITDLAGNYYDTEEVPEQESLPFPRKITISTNALVRWYANTPLFWGSIGGGAAVISLGAGLAVYFKKRRGTAQKKA